MMQVRLTHFAMSGFCLWKISCPSRDEDKTQQCSCYYQKDNKKSVYKVERQQARLCLEHAQEIVSARQSQIEPLKIQAAVKILCLDFFFFFEQFHSLK